MTLPRRLLLPLALLAGPAFALDVEFDDAGLARLRAGGVELLESGAPSTASVVFRRGDSLERVTPAGQSSFDREHRTFRIDYEWGALQCAWREEDGGLTLELTLRNGSPDPIVEWTVDLLRFRFPTPPSGLRWSRGLPITTDNVDRIAHIPIPLEPEGLEWIAEDLEPPLRLEFPSPLSGGTRVARVGTAVWNGPADPVLPPGGERVFRLALRPAKPDPLAGLRARFRENHPRILEWTDRRPIGMLALASAAHRSPANPGGWLNDASLDTANRPEFRRRLLERADDIVARLRAAGAQGLVFWDLEGDALPSLKYAGDPTLLPVLASDLDAVADAFFSHIREAGFRTGVCIRPSKIDTSAADRAAWRHADPEDALRELDRKIRYARERWGCTLFYIDSSETGFRRHDGSRGHRPIDSGVLRELAKRHSVLLIPEDPLPAWWACTAPLVETGKEPGARAIWPEAFSVLDLTRRTIPGAFESLVEAVRQGDVPLFRCWFGAPEARQVDEINEALGRH